MLRRTNISSRTKISHNISNNFTKNVIQEIPTQNALNLNNSITHTQLRNFGSRKKKIVKERLPVILLQDMPRLGLQGEQVKVKPGYMRNYLYPKQLAAYSIPENIKKYKREITNEKRDEERESQEAKQVIRRIERNFRQLTIKRHTPEPPETNNPVTKENIADKIFKYYNIRIKPEWIELTEDIHQLGNYSVPITVGSQSIKIELIVKKR
eukprot:gb/GECH01004364.1/.p1 GENE.gb/GECH01004364.1/~~gb/GECH01004364.1/.p1  ORF type:complete len:210 (+),score=60.43 gb/GECH01004364.1/:1-630(+)